MDITKLNESFIKSFAGSSKIHERGYEYYEDGNISSLEYYHCEQKIIANVTGNYGDYDVEIKSENNKLDADCNCPYDGYPCKHVIAVLLEFTKNSDKYNVQAQQKGKENSSLEEKLKSCSKDELLKIITESIKKYPDFKRDMQLRFIADNSQTIKSIKKQINNTFGGFPEYTRYDDYELAKKLKSFIKSVANSDDKTKLEIYWAVAENILDELKEYGIYEVPIEDVALDAVEKIVNIFHENENLNKEKKEIIEKLTGYCFSDCSISDNLYDYAEKLCTEKKDYLIIIEQIKLRPSYNSYYKGLLAGLYKKIDNEKSQLKTLESNLQYGTDYWELAQFWLNKGDEAKALEIVLNGIKKSEGLKEALYSYMENYYLKQNDYEKILDLLKEKVSHNQYSLNGYLSDSAYKLLYQHYQKGNDYQGIKNLFNLALYLFTPDFTFYKETKKVLNESDFIDFEDKIIKKLEKEPKKSLFYGDSGDEILAQIYSYKKDIENLYNIAKKSINLLQKYEKELLSIYPEDYLKKYLSKIDKLISLRGRENYKTAIGYLKGIKKIYKSVLCQAEKWDKYIHSLKNSNKMLRAFQEELKDAGI